MDKLQDSQAKKDLITNLQMLIAGTFPVANFTKEWKSNFINDFVENLHLNEADKKKLNDYSNDKTKFSPSPTVGAPSPTVGA